MSRRDLYIAAYDISDAQRLHEALLLLKRYASGGQKSVFECFLDADERRRLLGDMRTLLDDDTDRFLLLPLRAGQGERTRTLGRAAAAIDPDFFYVG
ncbi:CRISPR-associated endonuclease Cas2 [Plasticicumulans acidivorans]|uniref:CRISPR-associated endoribonuclease Cas2 n=1 Tax=Plasticicumulans acidivorans TaxID=886464 RepID=A0A317N088_9GAMM|nr:CRISPR-associated endonuclease Cas2 [Plasticicumulans acidivorans]PWV65982.1 CRISPR-associated protein Cas2 [Plasticicumulans acidivorans]